MSVQKFLSAPDTEEYVSCADSADVGSSGASSYSDDETEQEAIRMI